MWQKMRNCLDRLAFRQASSHIEVTTIQTRATRRGLEGEPMKHVGFIVAMLVVVWAGTCDAQTTTGRLMVRTLDESDSPLPGVTVTISSPALIGGAQTKATDDRGEATFLSLAI